ncbi:MAG: DUF1553 domain-containing protein [Planctomycetaceae bacterium]|nr:DUF1553 domain-containing protein [Planctomycetaceae bacterium]
MSVITPGRTPIVRFLPVSPALLVALFLLIGTNLLIADERDDYLKTIKPLLRERCYSCHGGLKQEAELRLDTVELMIEGGAIAQGDPENSLLLARVSAANMAERMPPEHEGEPLSAEQIELLRQWISNGAVGPADEKPEDDPSQHWAFQQVVRPEVPVVEKMDWVRNPIDAFIAREHEERGLTPQPEASRLLLLRRLSLDLIGLPPTANEIAECLRDESLDWYEQTVKRLLDDPRHGERWARHWMDIWRYSDWWGLGQQLRNSQHHIWHWRDWIIESLNEDLGYDEMVRLMLSADELYPNDLDKLRASGYLARNYFLFNRPQWMEETVEHVSKGFLGLTMNCTKCHDHKYDPFEQTDFYRMRAFFEPYHVRLDLVPGELDLEKDGIPRVFDGLPDEPTYRYVRGEAKNPDTSTVIAPGVPEVLAFANLDIEPVPLPDEAWDPARRPWVLEAYIDQATQKLKAAESKRRQAQEQLASTEEAEGEAEQETSGELRLAELNVAVANAELASVQRRAEAMRGSWEGLEAEALRERTTAAVTAERELAVASAKHKLADAELRRSQAADDKKEAIEKEVKTAQEAVGKAEESLAAEIGEDETFTPLVGAQWTPTRFMFSGKDDPTVKFSPKSTGRRTALAKWLTDSRNPLTARVAANHIWTRHMGEPLVATVFEFGRNGSPPTNQALLDWLAAELMDNDWSMKHLHRLIVTSATYRMSSSSANAEANVAIDPDNRYWWRRVPIRLESQVVRDSILSLAGTLDPTMGGPPIPATQQADSHRRSLYFFHSNNDRNLFLTTFDEALVKDCYRREQSVVPQQALALTNSQQVLDAMGPISERLFNDVDDDAAFVRNAFSVLLGIEPKDEEMEASMAALAEWRALPDATSESPRANLVWALMNHNDFVTLR